MGSNEVVFNKITSLSNNNRESQKSQVHQDKITYSKMFRNNQFGSGSSSNSTTGQQMSGFSSNNSFIVNSSSNNNNSQLPAFKDTFNAGNGWNNSGSRRDSFENNSGSIFGNNSRKVDINEQFDKVLLEEIGKYSQEIKGGQFKRF